MIYHTSFLLSLPISKNYHNSMTRRTQSCQSVREHHALADYIDLITLQLPSRSISLTLSMQKSKISTTYLSQVLHTHSKVQQLSSVLATPPVCAMSHCFTFSVSVMCYCSSRSSPDCFITKLIKQTA